MPEGLETKSKTGPPQTNGKELEQRIEQVESESCI
jgi:hypothetical protein